MQRHYGLSDADRSTIVSMNGYRSNCGYGGGFIRKYPDVDEYAQFVRNLMEKYWATNLAEIIIYIICKKEE